MFSSRQFPGFSLDDGGDPTRGARISAFFASFTVEEGRECPAGARAGHLTPEIWAVGDEGLDS